MAAVATSLRPFDPSEISLSGWLQLFTEFCTCNQIPLEPIPDAHGQVPHNRRRAYFLSLIGLRAYEVLRCECLPHQPNAYTIRRLTEILKTRFEPEGLLTTNRYQFSTRNQGPQESAQEFIAQLQLLASRCNFGMGYYDALRDRLVAGIRSNDCRIKLLSTPNLTFVLAKEIILQDDAVKAEAKIMAQALSANFVSRNGFKSKPKSSNQSAPNSKSKSSFNRPSTKPNSNPTQERKWGPCHRCTKRHDYYSCPAVNWVCHACNQKGHTPKSKRCPKNKNYKANVASLSSGNEQGTTPHGSNPRDDQHQSVEDEIERLLRISEV